MGKRLRALLRHANLRVPLSNGKHAQHDQTKLQYIYWLLSCFTVDVQGNARNGGIFRCVEAIGQAVSCGINSNVSTRFIPL